MNDRLNTIEEKLDGVHSKIDGLTGLVKQIPGESRSYSPEVLKQFEATEERMRLLANMLRKLPGADRAQETYTVPEAALRLGLRPFTVRQKCNLGFIKGTKVDGAGEKGEWRITDEELRRYEKEGDLNPPEPPPR
jgi:hypothetical protein